MQWVTSGFQTGSKLLWWNEQQLNKEEVGADGEWQNACSSNPVFQCIIKQKITWNSLLAKKQATMNVDVAAECSSNTRPASSVTPIHPQSLPLRRLSYLTLHSSVCVYALLTWISGCLFDTHTAATSYSALRPSLQQRSRMPSSSPPKAQNQTMNGSVNALFFFLRFTSFFASLFCPWNPLPEPCTHLVKSASHTVVFMSISCFAPVNQVYCSVPFSSKTWERAGTFSPKSRSTAAVFTYSNVFVWAYECTKG